jgi:hypothetical protein
MKKTKRLVFGVGVIDVNYPVHRTTLVEGKKIVVWVCPYYIKWKEMLRRCFSENYQEKYPSYAGCCIHIPWLYLSNFIKWVDEQPNKNWENCHLDKDVLAKDSSGKLYSPDTSVFVLPIVNNFMVNRGNDRGNCLLGVHLGRKGNWSAYISTCSDPFQLNPIHIGCFKTELEAHKAWQAKKHEYACQLAELQEDPRVAQALRERYAPDKDWMAV